MKSLLMKCCCLALIAAGLSNASYAIALPKANEDCYPIRYFDSLRKAVTQYKELATSSSPVLMPTWLPFDATPKSVRIVGCGTVLKTEYINDYQKIRVHVYPQMQNSRLIGSYTASLSDGTQAEFFDTKLFFGIRFAREGRNYMILIDRTNVKPINKEIAIKNLKEVANSMNVVE